MSSITNAGGIYLKTTGPKLEVHIGPNHEDRRVLLDGKNFPCSAINVDMQVGEIVSATVTFYPSQVDIVGSIGELKEAESEPSND